MLRDVTDLNVPIVCDHFAVARAVLSNGNVGFIPNKTGGISGMLPLVVNNKHIFIDNSVFESDTAAIAFLSQSLIGKQLYVPIVGGCSWLPLRFIQQWLISTVSVTNTFIDDFDILTDMDRIKGASFVKVEFEDETCIADIVCNVYKYQLDVSSFTFKRHSNPEWNLVKYNVRKDINILSGGDPDRIADYGRIILFLLSKVELTEEEKAYITPLLEHPPTVEALSSIICREQLIQRFIAEAKASPIKYLEWQKSWGKFWWENNE